MPIEERPALCAILERRDMRGERRGRNGTKSSSLGSSTMASESSSDTGTVGVGGAVRKDHQTDLQPFDDQINSKFNTDPGISGTPLVLTLLLPLPLHWILSHSWLLYNIQERKGGSKREDWGQGQYS